MKVNELIEQLSKLPQYATVRVLKNNNDFYYNGKVDTVSLTPRDDDDDYGERYIDIK